MKKFVSGFLLGTFCFGLLIIVLSLADSAAPTPVSSGITPTPASCQVKVKVTVKGDGEAIPAVATATAIAGFGNLWSVEWQSQSEEFLLIDDAALPSGAGILELKVIDIPINGSDSQGQTFLADKRYQVEFPTRFDCAS